jgi:signal transduction histidine kinase/DNA-binding response OmpR family regulator
MNKLLLFLLVCVSCCFGQVKNIDTKTITILDEFKNKSIANYFTFVIDTTQNLSINKIENLKVWKEFDNTVFIKQLQNRIANYQLWLRTNIENTTNDTVNLVVSMNNFRRTTITLQSGNKFEIKKIGYLINAKKRDFEDDGSSFKLQLLPNQEKQVTLSSYVDYLSERGVEIKLQTQENYDSTELKYINNRNYLFALFTLLTGGILIMLLYNIVLYVQYREQNYLYYSLHLLFTFFNYSIVADGFQQDFFGNISEYRDLMLESSYVLSFIFYSVFVFSVLNENTKRATKKLFIYYVGFMIVYFLSVQFVFHFDNATLISNFVYPAFIFRIVSCVYGIFIIYQLLKTHKNSYLKYIMYGTLVLIISYFIHVIFNLFIGNSIVNHYFNLIGTLIEILFFTYALNLRKKIAEQERDVLIKMNALKSRFFANISHEFRTPLTLIKSPVQSLKSKTTDENQLKELTLIDNNSNRMLELVDQLLELSKIDSGNLKLILKENNIANFLNTVIEPFAFEAKDNSFNFISNIQKSAQNHLFDKDVVQKVVTNLLSNAFKYTAKNGTITFESIIENQELQLKISNSGTKVKKEDLPKLFERFYQKKEHSQGVGIGLSLVKELVDLYNGKIKTEVQSGVLSFTILIPLKNVTNAVVLPIVEKTDFFENQTESNNEKQLLLIVDDNAEVRAVIANIFADSFTILQAQDGQQAFKMAQKEIPDCIISDVVMPKMNGFEFTKNIKNNELTSFVPIVLLTAKSSDDYKLEGLQSTADAFLTKPFNNEILKATVNQLISERKKLQKRYSQELVLRPVDIVINSVDEKFLQKLQTVLDNELSNSEFSSDNFANAVGMSRMQLHRKLKTLLGVSATEFLRNERLKVAAELLKKGNGNISDVAYAVGFNDVSYFSKCFKEVYKCTPTEFL